MVLKHVLVLFSLLTVGFASHCHVCGEAKQQMSNVGVQVYGDLCKDENDLGKNNTMCPAGFPLCVKFTMELSGEAKKLNEKVGQLGDILKGLSAATGGQAGPPPDVGLIGKDGTVRGCAPTPPEGHPGNGCISQSQEGSHITMCYCGTDNCNGAESLGRSGVLVLFTTLFLACCTKLFA